MKRASNRRKYQKSDGIQDKNRAERHRHLVFVGFHDRSDRGNRAAAADGGSRRNQERRVAANPEELAERCAQQQRKRNSQRRVEKSSAAGAQHFLEIHSEAEGYDGTLQENPRHTTALTDIGMREAETEKNSYG